MSGRLDLVRWKEWCWIADSGYVYNREWVIKRGNTVQIMATANATVILDRLVRRGRSAWAMRQSAG